MGIWIRSQDKKKLVNCEWFMSDKWGGDKFAITGDCGVPYDTGESVLLGIYSSEPEAMQVLDMIQERIVHQEQVRLMPSQDWLTPSIVFQMPPAGFNQQPEKFIPGCGADLNHCELSEIAWAEENLKSMGAKQRERVTEIVAVYRTLRPKEGDKGE